MTDTSGANAGDGGASPPSASTVVHLLRHGEVYNPGRILYGRLPGFHLSEDGRLMAKAATGFLAGRDVVALRSSPLDRARETAAPLAAQFGLEVEVDAMPIGAEPSLGHGLIAAALEVLGETHEHDAAVQQLLIARFGESLELPELRRALAVVAADQRDQRALTRI